MKRPRLTEAGYALVVALLLMIGGYVIAYCSTVRRIYIAQGDLRGLVVADYRFGGAGFFRLAHEVDRRIRPRYWSSIGMADYIVEKTTW